MKNNATVHNRMRRVIALVMASVMLLGAAFTIAACASNNNTESLSNYLKVSSGGERLEMKVTLTEEGLDRVSLFALEPWQTTADIGSMAPIAECKVKDNEVSVKYDIEGSLAEALCRGYVLAKHDGSGYKAVSGIYYVANPRDVHKNTGEGENVTVPGIKGALGSASQLIELGASSTVITVDIGKLMAAEGGIGRIPFVWNGYTCYADRDAVEMLDREIKSYSDAGIYVFLELVQTRAQSELPEGLKSIAFPSNAGAEGYALNMTERDGAVKICAMLDFIAGRYAAGGDFGHAEAFIIGRNVNNYAKYYVGEESAELSAQNYMSAVRAAYSILMSHTPKGRVYVSVDNNWNVANSNAREFLSTIAGMADDGGDFYWQVAIEANASDATMSSIWKDDHTGEHPKFISPANIEVLSSLLSTGQFTCNGMKRNILLNRFAVGGDNEDARAASYAYAYYKCLDVKNVDGLIYAKVADKADDVIMNGLLTAEVGGKLSQKKTIGDVFSSIDNVSDGQVNTLGSTVGSVWERLYADNKKDAVRRDVTRAGFSGTHSGSDVKIHTTFAGGDTFGFVPVASVEYAELRYSSLWGRPALYVSLAPKVSSDGAGVATSRLRLEDVKNAGFIGISALATVGGSSSVDITVRLSGYTKDGTEKVLVCMGRCTSNSWIDLYCDVSDFLKDIKSDEITMTVLASSSDGKSRADSLWLAQVMTEGPVKKGMATWLIITIIAVVVLGAGATVFIIWFRKNYTFVREDEPATPVNDEKTGKNKKTTNKDNTKNKK